MTLLRTIEVANMTNSVKTILTCGPKQPTSGNGGVHNANFSCSQASPQSVPASTGINAKRLGSISSSFGAKLSAKSFRKLQKNFAMSPRISNLPSSESPDKDSKVGTDGGRAPGFDPSARSESIGTQHRLPIGQHLVTQIQRRPTMWPEEFKDEPEFDPDEEARRRRRQIEAALRMYPRNTWGPVSKWGYLDEIPGAGEFKQKEHFKDSNSICNPDKLEKERLAARDTGHQRNWIKYKDATHQWEDEQESRKSLTFCETQDTYARDAEKMLHAQNDQRLAAIKKKDAVQRSIKNSREFTRLEKREVEFVKKVKNEELLRENPGARKIKSSVPYDILAPDFNPGPESFAAKMKKWRANMRSLRIQSKQSGARMFDVISWKPQKLCRVPPPKPDPILDAPREILPTDLPALRCPSPPRPRNILHSLDRLDTVPVCSSPAILSSC